MKFCSNCGSQIADQAVVCVNCGTPVNNNAPVAQPAANQYAAAQAATRYCPNCGSQISAQAVVCVNCGCAVSNTPGYNTGAKSSGMTTAAKVLMILGTIFMGIYILPLAWCLPLTIVYCKKVKNNEPIGTGFKVCCLLFVSLLGGIFMLCDKDH